MITEDRDPDVSVSSAAIWLIGLAEPPQPIVPELRARFGLTAKEAIEAIRAANEIKRSAGAK